MFRIPLTLIIILLMIMIIILMIIIIILMMFVIIILMTIIINIFGIVFIIFGGRLMQDRDSALEPGQWKAEECEFAFFRLLFLKSSVMLHQGRSCGQKRKSNFNIDSICLFSHAGDSWTMRYKTGKHSKSKYYYFRHGRLFIIMILTTYGKTFPFY